MIIENEKEYLKHIAQYLYITKGQIDRTSLERVSKELFKIECDIEFLDEEVEFLNNCILNNDYNGFIDCMLDKKVIAKEANKNIFLENIDDLWQLIMDNAYELWKTDTNINRKQFLSKLSSYEKIAVQFGNFNYQVENGGLMQWDDNGYSADWSDLYDFVSNSDFDEKENFISILEYFDYIKRIIQELDCYDDFYEQDYETRMKSLGYYDKQYYNIKEKWCDYFQEYLVKNMPDEYVDIIKERKLSQTSISVGGIG